MDRGRSAVMGFRAIRHFTSRSGVYLWIVPLVFLVLFFLMPMARIFSVLLTRPGVVEVKAILEPLWFTIWQAVLSTGLTLILGLPAAFVFSRFKFPGRKLFRLFTTLPFILPTVVVAAGFSALLGPRGLINTFLMKWLALESPPLVVMNTLGVILLAHVFYNLSIVIRVVGSAISQLDPRLEQAGQVLGASRLKVLREITLPLLRPSILVAVLMVFLFDFMSFGVILLLGGPRFSTLEVAIYTQTLSMFDLKTAGVLSLLQLLCTIGLTFLYARVNGRRIIPLMPSLRSEGSRAPEGFYENGFVTLILILLVLILVLPLAALAIRSLTSTDATLLSGNRFSFVFYRELFRNPQNSYFYVPPVQAALNSIFYALITVILSVFLGVLTAYTQVRFRAAQTWMDLLIMLPLGTSAVTLGLAFLITFKGPPIDVKSFPLLIPIVHSLVALPFMVRIVQPALASIPDSVRGAAATLGASPWRVWREIEAPIIARAIFVGALFSFTISLGEFGATSFLARPETPTLPIAIYRFFSQPGSMNYGQAMAMATLLMVVCGVSIAILDLIQRSTQGDY
ncbi:MAG: iron ABC transporter permease [Chloroflexi bacterium]|nr:iron ABC transporter permease [Chloroflexota bacterium]